MPKAFRQRGKKKKSVPTEDPSQDAPHDRLRTEEVQPAGPSWIVPAPIESVNAEAPFGFVDADVKAYFRNVDEQLREWQDSDIPQDEDIDPNENRRIFLVAALQEMSSKERALATDPDCSTVLERMIYSMDDFIRRVFMDSLCGSYEQLSKHRFASHVVQTLLSASADTIARESRGVYPKIENGEDKGELRTMTQLIVDIAEELLPALNALTLDPFASHVVRALFTTLCPSLFTSEASIVRSKKSAAWKAKQGEFKSVLSDGKGKDASSYVDLIDFRKVARRFIDTMRDGMDSNETRSLAANKAACPVLQMTIRIEADLGIADEPDSLMDRVLVGLISFHIRDPLGVPDESDYLGTLLRDTTSSHLLETLVAYCPPHIFPLLWSTYFESQLGRLAVHPVANFVVAKAIERVSSEQLEAAVRAMSESWKKIRTTRPGVLRALIERASTLRSCENAICEAVCTAFELAEGSDSKSAVVCILHLQTPKEYREAHKNLEITANKQEDSEHLKRRYRKDTEDTLEPKIAGALILQSLINLSSPHNALALDSLEAMSIDEIISMAYHAISSRVLDAVLDSPAVPQRYKRSFMQRLIGHYHRLVDDRLGSRVGDRCWATADTFLKEKIARSLIPHEMALAGSFYGKFFARHLNLYLLQRRPDEWRTLQSAKSALAKATVASALPKTVSAIPASADTPSAVAPLKKRKRPKTGGDEIDVLFDDAFGRKVKRAALDGSDRHDRAPSLDDAGTEEKIAESGAKAKREKGDSGALGDVLSVIRAAPRGEGKGQKTRKHKG